MTQLTEHFSLAEMTASATGSARGLKNEPNAQERQHIQRTAEQMEVVRHLLGDVPIRVTSCFRSEAVNRAVGGSKTSAHRFGLACDFTAPKFGNVRQICQALIAAQQRGQIDFDQLICEFPDTGGWVHLGLRVDVRCNRHQVLTAVKRNGKTVYLAGVK